MLLFVDKIGRVPLFSYLQAKPTLADKNRAHFRDQQWKGIRLVVIRATALGGIAFMLWFLVCLSYLYGTLYLSPSRHAAFKVLAVDYDGGIVGQALRAAYEQLKGPSFFTLEYHTPEEYASTEDMYQAVWRGDFWAAISASEGASSALAAALQGGDAADSYNPSSALHYIWNQQYYTTFANSIILNHMVQLVGATRIAYNKINGTAASATLNTTSPAAINALLNPIQATAANIMPVTFGTSIFLNTVSMAMPVLQQFFFLLVLNGVLGAHQIYRKMTVRSSLFYRRISGLLFTLGAALCQTGYYWAFRENWNVDGTQFVLTWMTFWLLMHIHLLILDTVSTLAPLPVMPFVVLLWVLLNISSTATPLESQANIYHWHVALPSHEAYSLLVTIWTLGSHNRVYRALPILFSWWIVANITTTLSHIRACHLAYKLGLDQDVSLEQINADAAAAAADMQKDVEAGLTPTEEVGEPMSLQNTVSRQTTRMTRTTTGMSRQKTIEVVAMERRQVYGPSIPPFA